jgi:hypothetical protein
MLNFLYGSDVYLMEKEAKRLSPGATWKSEGFDVNVLRNLNLFGVTSEVWSVSDVKANAEVLIEASELALTSEVTLTVLALSPDMRLKVTKSLLKGNSKQFKLLDPWDRKGIVALIKTLAEPYGFKFKAKTFEFVADSFGNDSGRIDCEFQKLKSVYPDGLTDEQAVAAMSKSDTDTVFDFVDAVLDLELAKALKLLYALDEPTQKTVALLTQKVHNVYCVSLGVPAPISPAQENFFKRKYNKGSLVYLGILTALNSMSPYPNRDDLTEALYNSLGGSR